MPADKKLRSFLCHELKREKEELESRVEGLVCMLSPQESYLIEPEFRELFRRLMLTEELVSLFGMVSALGWKYGYYWQDVHIPKVRLDFVHHFISYGILDDGDPGLGWKVSPHCVSAKEYMSLYKDRSEEEKKIALLQINKDNADSPNYVPASENITDAQPTIVLCKEMWPLGRDTVSLCEPENVIKAIDWYEIARKEKDAFWKEKDPSWAALSMDETSIHRRKKENEARKATVDITNYILEESKRRCLSNSSK